MAFKRVLQLLVLGILVLVNWQVSAKAKENPCEGMTAYECCTEYVCPTHEAECAAGGGTGGCYWNHTSQTCEMTPCMN